MQQRRAVRATIREERDIAAGDEELATKSWASSVPQFKKRNQGDDARGTEWRRARSTVINPQALWKSEELPVTEGISPKSRGDERTEIPEHRVCGKTAPVTAR